MEPDQCFRSHELKKLTPTKSPSTVPEENGKRLFDLSP
jgi:hypothetical protein